MKLIKSGHFGAIKYYLNTQGKDRGYFERHAIAGYDGGPVQVQRLPSDLSDMSDSELEVLSKLIDKVCRKENPD